MTKRNFQYDDEDDDILKDGEHVRVPMMLCDGFQRDVAQHYARPAQITDAIGRTAGHRPGFLLTDTSTMRDAAEAARTTRNKLLADAWREQAGAWQPTETPDLVPFKPSPDADAAGTLSATYLAEKLRVSNAWRTPAGSINPSEKARAFERGWGHNSGDRGRSRCVGLLSTNGGR